MPLKLPKNLSPRISWLRDYYFQGTKREWNNEFTAWTTGTDWDIQYNELSFYVVPENHLLMQTMVSSFRQAARPVQLPEEFWTWSIPERRAWFNQEVMVNHVPQEILPGDLIAGARFNIQTSLCLDENEARQYHKLVHGKNGSRVKMQWFHERGFGNCGPTSGHLIPGYERVLKIGWKGIHAELEARLAQDNVPQLCAMLTASTMPRELALKYSDLCKSLAEKESNNDRKQELLQMGMNLARVPWEPAQTFWEAVQALWLTHMLVMSDENYPGPGISFGRIDQYLFPYWKASLAAGMDREFGKEILKCFWIHANTAYDAFIQVGQQGINAGFGQLITLSGRDQNGRDTSNDLTYAILEVIDDMSPILEPKPNVRLHRNSPEPLLDKITDMISTSQGAPFLLNFDERSIAGMLHEAKMAGITHLIHPGNVHEYAPVGCLENTMVGNDRSGTVDNNLNLIKAVELALTGGKELVPFEDPVTGKPDKIRQLGLATGDATRFKTWESFWKTYEKQTRFIIKKCVETYEISESIRARFFFTPYLSCLVKGCAEKAMDITEGAAEISFTTLQAVTYATTVDSLLAIRYLVFDRKLCSLKTLLDALRKNWEGHAILQSQAKFKAPKYGRDDDQADALAKQVMDLWTEECWKYKTRSTGRQFRPGMLSWNYWAGDSHIVPASADGRPRGHFLSNAICPSNGADIEGPTANANSVGKVLGGKTFDEEMQNCLPAGASHTITFNPDMLNTTEQKTKFKAFLKGYISNGGTALQINVLDPKTLMDAQKNPEDYRHLLVRITGYNAYFTTVGRELQDEVIARVSHTRR